MSFQYCLWVFRPVCRAKIKDKTWFLLLCKLMNESKTRKGTQHMWCKDVIYRCDGQIWWTDVLFMLQQTRSNKYNFSLTFIFKKTKDKCLSAWSKPHGMNHVSGVEQSKSTVLCSSHVNTCAELFICSLDRTPLQWSVPLWHTETFPENGRSPQAHIKRLCIAVSRSSLLLPGDVNPERKTQLSVTWQEDPGSGPCSRAGQDLT